MARIKPDKHFKEVPGPWKKVIVQTNGDLAIIQDARNYFWLVNRRYRKAHPERFESLSQAKREASSLSFMVLPGAPSPKWKEQS